MRRECVGRGVRVGGCASVLFTCKLLKSKSFLLCHVASVWLGFRPGLVCSCPGNWQLATGPWLFYIHPSLPTHAHSQSRPLPAKPLRVQVCASHLYTRIYIYTEQCVSAHKTKQNHLSIMKQEAKKKGANRLIGAVCGQCEVDTAYKRRGPASI